MNANIIAEAQSELIDAALYLERQRPGYGEKFLLEFENVVLRIFGTPNGWRALSQNARRCNFHGFPYGAVYII